METGADSPEKSAPPRRSLVVSLHDVSPHTWPACTRILDELAALHLRAGLAPTGFIAPAWLLSEPGEEALRDLGLAYTTRLGGVWELQRRQIHRSQSLCWSVRAAWRRMLSLAWNAYLFSRLEHTPLLRIAVHPVDIDHPRIWWQIKRMIAVGMKTRMAETYESWVK
jgi:predicted deacetylase